MRLDEQGCGLFRFSTSKLSPAKRLPALKDIFGEMVKLELAADESLPTDARMTVHVTPGLRRTEMISPVSARVVRPKTLLPDGEDSVCLILATGGKLAMSQRGAEAEAGKGDALMLMYRDTAELRFSAMTYSAVRVPFAALEPMAGDLESATARRIPHQTEALRLLRAYLPSLPDRFESPQLAGLAASHVYDLIALATGASREAAEHARNHGVCAARLEAIKSELSKDSEMTIEQVAARQGVSTRYVQMLFERDGSSFTAFTLGLKLDAVRAMLASPRYESWSVTDIAFEAGFGDLSYFNRTFRRRFDMTPSGYRQQSRNPRGN